MSFQGASVGLNLFQAVWLVSASFSAVRCGAAGSLFRGFILLGGVLRSGSFMMLLGCYDGVWSSDFGRLSYWLLESELLFLTGVLMNFLPWRASSSESFSAPTCLPLL